MAFEAGLQVDPSSDALKKGLADVKKAMDADTANGNPFGSGGDMGMGRMFSDPGLSAKLEANPKTKEYMKDPTFRGKVAALQASGGRAGLQDMMSDPRMLTVLGVMMGIDIVNYRTILNISIRLTMAGRHGAARGLRRCPRGLHPNVQRSFRTLLVSRSKTHFVRSRSHSYRGQAQTSSRARIRGRADGGR